MANPTVEDAYNAAVTALERLDQHQEECGERYRQIVSNQAVSAQDRAKLIEQIYANQINTITTLNQNKSDLQAAIDTKINAMSTTVDNKVAGISATVSGVNKMLMGICLALIGAETALLVGVVVWFMNFKLAVQP